MASTDCDAVLIMNIEKHVNIGGHKSDIGCSAQKKKRRTRSKMKIRGFEGIRLLLDLKFAFMKLSQKYCIESNEVANVLTFILEQKRFIYSNNKSVCQ